MNELTDLEALGIVVVALVILFYLIAKEIKFWGHNE